MNTKHLSCLIAVTAALFAVGGATAQAEAPAPQTDVGAQALAGTAFTYQGQVKKGNDLVNGTCDFLFSLWDALSSGTKVGQTQAKLNVGLSSGLFTVQLDFGRGAFTGDGRWLEIVVRCPAGDGNYETLVPRQALTPAPYALALPGLYIQQNSTSPNVIGGYSGNIVSGGTVAVVGATISGGGVSGGINTVSASYGTVGGGYLNTAGDWAAMVGGGAGNNASGYAATVGGGQSNAAGGTHSTVGGGMANTASADDATVGGGSSNGASGSYATVSGGYNNTASGPDAAVGGGGTNAASSLAATVGGGLLNTASGSNATVAGGNTNTAGGQAATVGGGINNLASSGYSTVGGGSGHTVTDDYGTVGGGQNNQAGNGITDPADATHATVGGGSNNVATAFYATAGGGRDNTASASYATVGGGNGNTASGYAATVPGGWNNTAQGDRSLAAGHQAHANHAGAFVWADDTGADLYSSAANQFVVRSSGGITLYTNSGATIGVSLLPNDSTWNSVSDRNAKTNFAPIDGRDVLERLMGIPIQTWNYKGSAIPHIGPVAQDFHAAFGVGPDDKHISTVDADGVALAAIQGLYRVVQDDEARITALEERLAALEKANGVQPVPGSPSLAWLLFGGLSLLNLGFFAGRRWPLARGGR